ncbi:MAG: hypothetical protein M3238_06255 [Actinomycetota bacterium]|nr:hypothetical protein [Actinomycetota bacterium]
MNEDERAARYSDLFGENHEHTSDCAYCPICATIGLVRNMKPEVLDHLAAAAREFIIAAGLFLEEAGEVLGRAEATRRTRDDAADATVRRIDIG